MRTIDWKADGASFVKTYVTVFISSFLLGFDQGLEVFSVKFLTGAATVSLISVLRSVYKLLTEGE